MTIDDVLIEFTRGPIRAQRTTMRQRHGFPIVFDKHMSRDEVGDGELIALLSIREAPVPDEMDIAFARWRARALAAAGMVAAVLDERVVGTELFEDAVLLRRGEFVLAADMRGQVRSQYLPRCVPSPELDPRVELDAALGDEGTLVAGVVVDALEWQAPNATLAVRSGHPDHVTAASTMGADATAIWIAPERLEGLDDPRHPELLVNFVWELHGLVSASLAQRAGIASEGEGATMIEALASFARYRRSRSCDSQRSRARARDAGSRGARAGSAARCYRDAHGSIGWGSRAAAASVALSDRGQGGAELHGDRARPRSCAAGPFGSS
jgi:hypothetical protein